MSVLTTSTHSQQRCPPPLFIRNWYKSWSLLFSMSFCPPQSVFLRLSCMQDCTFRRLINHRVPQISARHTYPYQSQKSCTINQLRAQHALEHLQKPVDFCGSYGSHFCQLGTAQFCGEKVTSPVLTWGFQVDRTITCVELKGWHLQHIFFVRDA